MVHSVFHLKHIPLITSGQCLDCIRPENLVNLLLNTEKSILLPYD